MNNKNSIAAEDAAHKLKLSIDLSAVKNLQFAANLICTYQIKLS